MPSRDQTVILSRQTILLVTAVGVGLLTLCYVLGVQVGKQSAALRHPLASGAGEDLQALPASVEDQLKALENSAAEAEFQTPGKSEPATDAPAPAAAPPTDSDAAAQPAEAPPAPAAPAPKPVAAAAPEKEPAETTRWTLQLISTPDSAEAQHMAAKARAAGFPATVITDKGLLKVRLVQPASREAIDATAVKLKNRGFKPFAIKVE